ncbi:Hypothetical protein AA314_09665 [Archangium gephyra]|uniref:Uncharacterized protein n=1 Tax=Archangium gephyra TaxID=48 RepID=A0AAC8QIG2_9BACT|nr:Hypothetical protein AA314_09665 [Archangium gephyra]
MGSGRWSWDPPCVSEPRKLPQTRALLDGSRSAFAHTPGGKLRQSSEVEPSSPGLTHCVTD